MFQLAIVVTQGGIQELFQSLTQICKLKEKDQGHNHLMC